MSIEPFFYLPSAVSIDIPMVAVSHHYATFSDVEPMNFVFIFISLPSQCSCFCCFCLNVDYVVFGLVAELAEMKT